MHLQTVFKVAEDLLQSITQNPRLSIFRAQGAWLLVGSLMTLGKRNVFFLYIVDLLLGHPVIKIRRCPLADIGIDGKIKVFRGVEIFLYVHVRRIFLFMHAC